VDRRAVAQGATAFASPVNIVEVQGICAPRTATASPSTSTAIDTAKPGRP